MRIASERSQADKADRTDSTIAPDTNRTGRSRVANRDGKIGNKQPLIKITSTPTPGDDDSDTSEYRQLELLQRYSSPPR